MAEKIYNLDLSLGFKTFRIKFAEFDDPVDILFNPADADLPKRLFEAQKRIENSIKDVEPFELDENGLPKTDEYIEKTNKINQIVFEAIDYAFGNKISDKLFSHCSPFAITNGKQFVLQFIEKITPALEKIINAENKKSNEYANKHLAKYMKK